MYRKSLLALCAVALVVSLTGCFGTVVPPGKQVILVHPSGETEVIRHGSYKPWGRTKAYYVDQKLKSYAEQMQILCADGINMDVEVKLVTGFDIDDTGGAGKANMTFIKEKVPVAPSTSGDAVDGDLSLDEFYTMVVQDVLRNTARNTISPEMTDDINGKRIELEKTMQVDFTKRCKELNYPLLISAVLISNLDYPDEVTEKRKAIASAKLQDEEDAALAEAQIAKAERQVAIETEEAKSRLIKAQAQADENMILTESLTPQFLMWRQFEVLDDLADKLANGENNTVFMMPYQMMSPEIMNSAMIKSSIDDLKATKGVPLPEIDNTNVAVSQ